MEGGCWTYCALLSAFGCFLLVQCTQAGCGLALKSEYQFIPIRKDPALGDTSLVASGIYLAICLLCLALILWKRRTCTPQGAGGLPAGPAKSTIELTESEH